LPDNLNNYDYVFVCSDFGFPLKADIVQFLTGAEKCYENIYSWSTIDLDAVVKLPVSEESEVPSVGFVGRIPLFNKDAQTVLHRGFEPRYFASKSLMEGEVCFDAHIRWEPEGESCSFYPAIAGNHKKDEPLFRNNLLANQYNLCARGNGNYSQRLYETLAAGRIPVYIESGGRIPFDHFVDYQSFDDFVWVTDPKKAAEAVIEFHETHNLKTAQYNCRKIYEDFLSPVAQVKLFERHLDEFEKFKSESLP
jgi:hypothetical protein